MATMMLWNSMARRRRSMSDTVYDNGLATLDAYLSDRGHSVVIVDDARENLFQGLSPLWISALTRWVWKYRGTALMRGLGNALQSTLDWIQARRMNRYLGRLARRVRDESIRVLGVKLWYGEAFLNACRLIEEVNRVSPETITIAGGYHSSLYEEHVLEGSGFDLGVMGEGEVPLKKILDVVEELESTKSESRNSKQIRNPNELMLQTSDRSIREQMKNLWFRIWNSGHSDLSRISDFEFRVSAKQQLLSRITDLAEAGKIKNLVYRKHDRVLKTVKAKAKGHVSKPVPAYTMNKDKVSIHVVVEATGCAWGKCNFCVHDHLYPGYAVRRSEELVAEMKAMRDQGIGIFRFAGSDTPPELGVQIGRKILASGLDVIFGMGSRAVSGARERFEELANQYETMVRAGLRAVFMGGETGNDRTNDDVMNKGLHSEDLIWTIKAMREGERRAGQRLYVTLALIYPSPLPAGVTRVETEEDNVALLRQAAPDSVMVTPPCPFIHTEWFNNREKYGFELADDFVQSMMAYEYVLYKPPELWPVLGVHLQGESWTELLAECSRFRRRVETELGLSTDLSDEHLLMFHAAGLRTPEEMRHAKHQTMLDIVSCDYRWTRRLLARVNAYSRDLCEDVSRQPTQVTEEQTVQVGLPVRDTLAFSKG